MKIDRNTSHVSSMFVRKLCTRARNEIVRSSGGKYPSGVGPVLGRWSRTRLTIRGRSGTWCSGRAEVGGYWMHFSLGADATTRDVIELAYHELMHWFGERSHEGGRCDPTASQLDRMCDGLPTMPERKPGLRSRPPARDIVLVRYERLLARARAWDSKLRRAEKALAKVSAELATYEGRYKADSARSEGFAAARKRR